MENKEDGSALPSIFTRPLILLMNLHLHLHSLYLKRTFPYPPTPSHCCIHCDGHPMRLPSTATVIYCHGHPLRRSSTATGIHCHGYPLQQSSTGTAKLSTATVIHCEGITVTHCDGYSLQDHPLQRRRPSTERSGYLMRQSFTVTV